MDWNQLSAFVLESDNERYRIVCTIDKKFSAWIREPKFKKHYKILDWKRIRERPFETPEQAKNACEKEESWYIEMGAVAYWKKQDHVHR